MDTRDRKALIDIRISLARIAQALKVNTADLPVSNKPMMNFARLHTLASTHEHGWHNLCLHITDEIDNLQNQLESLKRETAKPATDSSSNGKLEIESPEHPPVCEGAPV